jgi:hypothetical protein
MARTRRLEIHLTKEQLALVRSAARASGARCALREERDRGM